MNFLKLLLNAFPWRVSAGPFAGTRCQFTAGGDGVLAKLAGTYEQETYPAFAAALRRRPTAFVDIGAAEGFFVAALARALPTSRVVAYEAKAEWRERIQALLELNGVSSRCSIRGFCDEAEFGRLMDEVAQERAFILMDIEGGGVSSPPSRPDRPGLGRGISRRAS